jgi:hypothetical protein
MSSVCVRVRGRWRRQETGRETERGEMKKQGKRHQEDREKRERS